MPREPKGFRLAAGTNFFVLTCGSKSSYGNRGRKLAAACKLYQLATEIISHLIWLFCFKHWTHFEGSLYGTYFIPTCDFRELELAIVNF